MSSDESEHPHLSLLRAYFFALESNVDADNLAAFFTPDVEQREFPNRLVAQGAQRNLGQLLAGRTRGREVVADERYEILDAIVQADRAAIELRWTARVRVPLGSLQPGETMTARCGVFFRFKDGRICQQHNYDCFSAF